MFWAKKSDKSKQLTWWQQLDRDYPPGSKWFYLSRPCIVLSTHSSTLDGIKYPFLQIQYADNNGALHTCEACLEALVRPDGDGEGA